MNKILLWRITSLSVLIVFSIIFGMYYYPQLFNFAIIAITLGLRHGLDADHIIAIDNVTRKLIVDNKYNSSSTGFYFALGHSTIVFGATVLLIFSIKHASGFYVSLTTLGNKIGDIISIIFLCLTLLMNFSTLKRLQRQSDSNGNNKVGGIILQLANKYLFNLIDQPHKMFFVGLCFGLGFDTATEIGLLALAATSVLHGINLIAILCLPIIFACGMMLTDTLNSTFMSKIYRQIQHSAHKLQIYNYCILIFSSCITVLVIMIESMNHFNINIFSITGIFSEHPWLLGTITINVFIILWIVSKVSFNRKVLKF